MKVGTDGVLLGLWASASNVKTVLDVGTGTGLIAIMIAQRTNKKTRIKAIDIDENAIIQASENITQCPFKNEIVCEKIDLKNIDNTDEKYDLIISNPPFFKNSLQSPDTQRTLARHTDSLQMDDLIKHASLLLSEQGRLAVIYPYEEKESLIKCAEKYNLNALRITNVYPTINSRPKRVLMEFGSLNSDVEEDNLTIETGRHIYSDDFTRLAKDFYLKM